MFSASLWVYVKDIATDRYATEAPVLTWNTQDIQRNPNGWVSADQYLVVQTTEEHRRGAWAVQIYTDNTQATVANTEFRKVDSYIKNASGQDVFVNGGFQQGPLTPKYGGNQSIQVGSEIQFPKGGLISSDGRERLPLVWKITNPFQGTTVPKPSITQLPSGSSCDFAGCDWLYMLDQGDQKLTAQGNVVSNWQDLRDYVVPINQNGAQYAAASRFAPLRINGSITQLIFLGAHFGQVSRQPYATTVFVEYITL